MKAVDFDYERPTTLAAAIALLTSDPNARIMAGGQTLGPMLNLRLAQPRLIVDITRIPELSRIEETADSISYGGCTTHAAIEDGRVPDATAGFLPTIARGIAYRAVRNRGTVGGSLAHADPAADWLSCFLALGAELSIAGPKGFRKMALGSFVRGALHTDLAADEIVVAVNVPRLTGNARCGFTKINRKTGEFAHAIGVAVIDRGRGTCRLVAGAAEGPPLLLEAGIDDVSAMDGATLLARFANQGLRNEPYRMKQHGIAVHRALQKALSR